MNIRLYAKQDSGLNQLHITIADSGPGYVVQTLDPTRKEPHLENHTQQTESAESRAELAVIKTLVKAHHGQFQCEGNIDTGTRFHVSIPIDMVPIDPAPSPEQREDGRV